MSEIIAEPNNWTNEKVRRYRRNSNVMNIARFLVQRSCFRLIAILGERLLIFIGILVLDKGTKRTYCGLMGLVILVGHQE
jgi:hypothetical protein